jgi:hypothetical protein
LKSFLNDGFQKLEEADEVAFPGSVWPDQHVDVTHLHIHVLDGLEALDA